MNVGMHAINASRLTTAAVVIGAGVVIGVSGLFYVFFTRQQQRQLAHLTRTVESLRKDVGELKMAASDGRGCGAKISSTSKRTATFDRNVQADTTSAVDCSRPRSPAQTMSSSGDENGVELYFDVSDDDNYNTDLSNYGRDLVQDDGCAIDFVEIDSLLAGDAVENEVAYDKLTSQKNQGMTNPEFVWRLVRACYLCFLAARDEQRKKNLIADGSGLIIIDHYTRANTIASLDGIGYSIAGLAIDNNHPDLHKWYAVILGRSTDFLGIQDKIKNGFKFKEHLDQAIRLRPYDHTLYFMKGRWCYEVSMLTWVERKVAAALFAKPPTSSLHEARQQFLKVEELHPVKWKENLLYMAKCLIGEGNYTEAMTWLNKAENLISQTQDEEVVHVEVQQLLSKYRNV